MRAHTFQSSLLFAPASTETVYEELHPILRRHLAVRPLSVAADCDLVHSWMNRPHVAEYWEMAWPKDRIRGYLQDQVENPDRCPYIGQLEGESIGYLEMYDPVHDVLGDHYDVQEGDIGMHVLMGEERHLRRYTLSLGATVNRFLFSHPPVRRVVGEPDVENRKMLSLLTFLGYEKQAVLSLPGKTAALIVCERDRFFQVQRRHPDPQTVKTRL